MRNRKQLAVTMTAVLVSSLLSSVTAMAADSIRIDMTDNNDAAWANIAMANDDTVETGVNIRSSADPNSQIVGFLYRGGAVRVLYKGEEWTEVQSGSVTGYMKNEFLVYGAEAKGLAEHYGSYGAKASWNDVKIFAGASGSSQIVDTASDGDLYRLVARDGDWMTLQTGADSVAYVPAEDVSVVMVVDTAIPVGEEEGGNTFKQVDYVPETAGASSSETYYDDGSYDDGSYDTGSYDNSSYDDGSSNTGSYDNSSYDTAYTAPTYSTDADTGGTADELTARASQLYQEYLAAQQAADAAVANGSGEQAIQDTAAKAVAAYAKYVKVQNAADAASYGGSADPSANTGDSYSTDAYNTNDYSTNADTGGTADELAARASQLYQEYLAAQQAADAAVANGSGEQAIQDTAAKAAAAYAKYVKVQNAADAATWGGSVDPSAYTEDSYADTSAEYTDSAASTDTSASQTSSAASQVSASDLTLLSALIYCEAGNQPYEGQVAVGAVVMNRIASGAYPGNIHDVIYQAGQFMPTWDGSLARALANGSGAGYIQAATDALNGTDPTGGALYFNVHQGRGKKIGAHWFF